MTILRIATRKSPLALWQTEHVADRLRALHPDLTIELVPLSGERWEPLAQGEIVVLREGRAVRCDAPPRVLGASPAAP